MVSRKLKVSRKLNALKSKVSSEINGLYKVKVLPKFFCSGRDEFLIT